MRTIWTWLAIGGAILAAYLAPKILQSLGHTGHQHMAGCLPDGAFLSGQFSQRGEAEVQKKVSG
jgi:hypothetical protein